MTIRPDQDEGKSAPDGPLTRAERCRLIEEAGLEGCHLDRLAEESGYGWRGVRIYLALLDFASITGDGCWAADETVAERADVSVSVFQKARAALRKAGLLYCQQLVGEKGVWWPLHPADGASLPRDGDTVDNPSGSSDHKELQRDANRPGSGGESPELQRSASSRTDPTSDRVTDVTRSPGKTDEKLTVLSTGAREGSASEAGMDESGNRDAAPAQKRDDSREEIPPKKIGAHRGHDVYTGRHEERGGYLIWEHPMLLPGRLHAPPDSPPGPTFDHFLDHEDAPDVDLDELRRGLDGYLRAFAQLYCGPDGWSHEAAAAIVDELADELDDGGPPLGGYFWETWCSPPEPSEQQLRELREVAAHYDPGIQQELEAWIGDGAARGEVMDLYDRLLHRCNEAHERGEEPQLESLEVVLEEVA